jgi:cell division protein ZapA
MKKIDVALQLYDEELEVTINEEEKERYMAAAEYVTQKYNAYAQAYNGKKSDHTISLMTMLDIVLNPMPDK